MGTVSENTVHFGANGVTLCGELGKTPFQSSTDPSCPIKPVTCGHCRVLLDGAIERGCLKQVDSRDDWEVTDWPFQVLTSYDWSEAFTYAKAQPVEGVGRDRHDYNRCDVAQVLATDDGENDGPDWVGVFRMKDDRFMFLSAGCDYTGWDCRASGSAWWAPDLRTLWDRALNDDARQRLKSAEPK